VTPKSHTPAIKENKKQRKMEKKFYETPAVEVLEFDIESQLLAGTNFDPDQGIDIETGDGGGSSTPPTPIF
jgi:hypothetical protein